MVKAVATKNDHCAAVYSDWLSGFILQQEGEVDDKGPSSSEAAPESR